MNVERCSHSLLPNLPCSSCLQPIALVCLPLNSVRRYGAGRIPKGLPINRSVSSQNSMWTLSESCVHRHRFIVIHYRDPSVTSTPVDGPRKRRKLDQTLLRQSAEAWDKFQRDVDEFDMQHAQGHGKFAFDFVEGPLVRALHCGDWWVCRCWLSNLLRSHS